MSAIILRGINGANPLGYLAALGTLRLLGETARLHWVREEVWRPVIEVQGDAGETEICELLLAAKTAPADLFVSSLGKNITVERTVYETFVKQAHDGASAGDRRLADFAAAFGNEVCDDEKKNRIEYTPLCFITGSGHQDFLETMRTLKKQISAKQLHATLFEPWQYADKGLSMRWDPGDAKEYALRWSDPGPEGAWTVWGANLLAVEALPLFPSYPTSYPKGRKLQTTGFRPIRRGGNRTHEYSWPIWTCALGGDAVGTLVGMRELQEDQPDTTRLGAMGIAAVYRAQRVRIGAGANFKVSFRPARAM
jgi:hypothetical protein